MEKESRCSSTTVDSSRSPDVTTAISNGESHRSSPTSSIRNIVTPILIILRLGYPSQKDRKLYEEKFARLNTEILCELLSTAHGLELKPLVDLPSRALAQIIEGKIPEEIQDIIHLLDDLPEVIDVSGSL